MAEAEGERERIPLEPEQADRIRPSLGAVAITLAGLGLLAMLVVLVDPLRDAVSAALHGDTAAVRQEVDSLGVAGPLIILALALIHSVIFYPAEIVDAAAGFVYGFPAALALVMLGWLLNGLVCYLVGHQVARPVLEGWLGSRRFDRTEEMIERGGVTLLLSVRLIPILPFSLVSYAAGAARVPLWRFCWTTALGYLPITAIAVYLGTKLEGLHVTDPLVLASVGALLALLFAGRWIAQRAGGAG
ncbi:MAG: TVP38/TMEM64 family protein [Solirubrobacterales bacterium]